MRRAVHTNSRNILLHASREKWTTLYNFIHCEIHIEQSLDSDPTQLVILSLHVPLSQSSLRHEGCVIQGFKVSRCFVSEGFKVEGQLAWGDYELACSWILHTSPVSQPHFLYRRLYSISTVIYDENLPCKHNEVHPLFSEEQATFRFHRFSHSWLIVCPRLRTLVYLAMCLHKMIPEGLENRRGAFSRAGLITRHILLCWRDGSLWSETRCSGALALLCPSQVTLNRLFHVSPSLLLHP